MFFDALPPDTSAYMLAGYVIFFAISVIYLVSLLLRSRNLKRDLLVLENLQEEQQAKTAATSAAQSKPRTSKVKPAKAHKPQKKATRKK
jgi:hypothetical protein